VRRILLNLICLTFVLSLHASIPLANSAPAGKYSRDLSLESRPTLAHSQPILALTSAPADASFYEEFYSPHASPAEPQGKTGVLHWFASLIKRAVRR
jgi:hypothetical protein